VLKAAGIVLLVLLVLVGALLPLRYTARMKLPGPTDPAPGGKGAGDRRSGGATQQRSNPSRH
jgi:hypothetical protein